MFASVLFISLHYWTRTITYSQVIQVEGHNHSKQLMPN